MRTTTVLIALMALLVSGAMILPGTAFSRDRGKINKAWKATKAIQAKIDAELKAVQREADALLKNYKRLPEPNVSAGNTSPSVGFVIDPQLESSVELGD